MKDHYPSEKFSAAVQTLAVGDKLLHERLADAFAYSLTLLLTHSEVVPQDVMQRLREYDAAWTDVGETDGQGQISMWADQLSVDEAMDIARWIVETSARLSREYRAAD